MLPKAQKTTYDRFYKSAYENEILDPKTTLLLHFACVDWNAENLVRDAGHLRRFAANVGQDGNFVNGTMFRIWLLQNLNAPPILQKTLLKRVNKSSPSRHQEGDD